MVESNLYTQQDLPALRIAASQKAGIYGPAQRYLLERLVEIKERTDGYLERKAVLKAEIVAETAVATKKWDETIREVAKSGGYIGAAIENPYLGKVHALEAQLAEMQKPIPLPKAQTIRDLAKYVRDGDEHLAKFEGKAQIIIDRLINWDVQTPQMKDAIKAALAADPVYGQAVADQMDLPEIRAKVVGDLVHIAQLTKNRFENNIDLYLGMVPNRPFSPKNRGDLAEEAQREQVYDEFGGGMRTRITINTAVGGVGLTAGFVAKGAGILASKAAGALPTGLGMAGLFAQQAIISQTPTLTQILANVTTAIASSPITPALGLMAANATVEGGADLALTSIFGSKADIDPKAYGLSQPEIAPEEIATMARDEVNGGSLALKAGLMIGGYDSSIENAAPLLLAGHAIPSMSVSAEDLNRNLELAQKFPLQGNPKRQLAYEGNRVLGAMLAVDEVVAEFEAKQTKYEEFFVQARSQLPQSAINPLNLNNNDITSETKR